MRQVPVHCIGRVCRGLDHYVLQVGGSGGQLLLGDWKRHTRPAWAVFRCCCWWRCGLRCFP
ncbi:hypothetical protein CHLRE_08g373348v5 [Chlamydomonas reinhardtii]|uniref:Uncharacterized protein n=1 Tax=Chlamydomonas reinhardtii TaxID=3055 RepID=A0A2K3DHC9_CHLRE|nr:uncharacterized protein CHLRE_08g373348v5 [Chlamydomonas reinhardtii]PNW79953.1 hypothetical protein CHLRE_08g373348v5 [Chlamydomonas reinhardtii]